ncbi:hypothetical protein SAMN04488239_104317 [Ruegeria marina]|uniref:Uncharacterized protein n=1 Tax=Ruegeria marina TaxID=639004 RepID=A0A1G6R3M3_9RHOB|nr:hypothetical protein SAMN04488239_104317 [Ruegeria marina]
MQVIRMHTLLLILFGGLGDKAMAGIGRTFRKLCPGAGHFLQGDVGEDLARHRLAFILHSRETWISPGSRPGRRPRDWTSAPSRDSRRQ